MKILILTQYFPPETGAPQNRLHSLATYLSSFGAQVSILTAMPNYPQGEVQAAYKGKWFCKETDGATTVYRSWIYTSKSKGVLARLLNYFSFVFTALYVGLFKVSRHDIIICESPPLFLGITALFLKWIKSSKLVFNVSDLWPESAEKLNIVNNKLLLGVSYKLEKLLYKQADLVSGQTQGIIDNIQQRYPSTPLHLLRNGIDVHQFTMNGNREGFRNKHNLSKDAFVITYAGIIGHAQGLDILIETARQLQSQTQLQFVLVGDGPEKLRLMEAAATLNLSNIHFIPSVPRSEMPDVIAACDCYVTPLRKNDLFLGAIPSKIFEPLFYEKPVIMGVNGEAKDLFVDQGKCALHFEPENTAELILAIQRLTNDSSLYHELGKNGKQFVLAHFNRRELAQQFWHRLQTL